MTGIFLLIVMLLWVVIAFAIAMLAARLLPKRWWGFLTAGLFFFALLPLPLIDEILAKPQFEALCREKAVIKVEPKKARGKTVFLRLNEPDELVEGVAVPVRAQPWDYAEINTKEILISYKILEAKGGWLIRKLGISETNAPLLFKGHCSPNNRFLIFKELNIEQIQNSQVEKGKN